MLFAFFVLPMLVVSRGDLTGPLSPAKGAGTPAAPTSVDLVPNRVDLTRARNDVRGAAVALIAGIGAVIAGLYAARTFYLSRTGQRSDEIRGAADRLAGAETHIQVHA